MMHDELPDSAKILFISDVHLGGFSPEKNKQVEADLIDLVNFAENYRYKIAVLGDLFDYWMEYDNYIPKVGKKALERFATFNQKNHSLYITGNHDNWTQGYFEQISFDVERDFRLMKIDSKKILLMHGDAIGDDLENLQRPFLHRILRNKRFIKLYKKLLVRPKTGIQVMRQYSRFTNFLGKTDPAPLNKWSKKMLQTTDIDIIICGHDHVPRVHEYSYGTYLNSGTFYDHKTFVIYNNKQFRLVCWSRKEQKLIPFTSLKAEA